MSERLIRVLFLGLVPGLVACAAGNDPASAEAEGFAFPVVEGVAPAAVPVYRERGIPAVDGVPPEVDQVALIARVDGTTWSEAVSIRAFIGEPRFAHSEVVVDDRVVSISGDASSYTDVTIATLTDLEAPDVVVEVRGVDPVGFLTDGGLEGTSASVSTDDEPVLALTSPPAGYAIVLPPTTRERAAPEVTIEMDVDGRVRTRVHDPRFEFVPQAEFVRVRLGQREVWRGEVGPFTVVTWEEPDGVFTEVVSLDAARADELVRSTQLTDERAWRDHYGIDQPSDLLASLDGREFEAVRYAGYPFDPTLEDRPLTIAFVDDTIIIRGVCSTRSARVRSAANTVDATGAGALVGVGCLEFEDVDRWQSKLLSRPLSLSLSGNTLTVRTAIDGEDVVIDLAETTFSGYS